MLDDLLHRNHAIYIERQNFDNQPHEQKNLQRKFKIIILLSLIGGFIGLIIRNDVILFTFFFIAIVTSRSLVGKTKQI